MVNASHKGVKKGNPGSRKKPIKVNKALLDPAQYIIQSVKIRGEKKRLTLSESVVFPELNDAREPLSALSSNDTASSISLLDLWLFPFNLAGLFGKLRGNAVEKYVSCITSRSFLTQVCLTSRQEA